MSAPPSERTSLARLVLFMVCLAAAGSFVAGAHYYTIDLPQQNAVQAPTNACVPWGQMTCDKICRGTYCRESAMIYFEPTPICQDPAGYEQCLATEECYDLYPPCPPSSPCNDCRYTCDVEYDDCLKKPGYTEGDCAGIRDTCHSTCPCG